MHLEICCPKPARNHQLKRSIRVIKDIIYGNKLHSILFPCNCFHTQFVIEVPKGLLAANIGRKKSMWCTLTDFFGTSNSIY